MTQCAYEIVETQLAHHIGELSVLLEEHWQESARNKHLMVLKPDHERYKHLEASGALMCLAAIAYPAGAPVIVGYSANIITTHLHYADLLCAHNDVLFVAKDYRDSPLGLKLIRETERAAAARGARLMLWHAKEDTTLSKILPRMGCKVQEIIYTKEL